MHLARFTRVSLGHFPTPLEKLENLTKALGGPDIYIKRDDCTGLATGGNKTRKLEFLVADAMEKGVDTLVTQGATQSNHVRQTAAAARKVGMTCHALLERGSRMQETVMRLGETSCWTICCAWNMPFDPTGRI